MSITQILRVMKLTAILLTVCCVHLMAAAGAQTISYNAKNVSLNEIFKVVKKQTGYFVVYNATQINTKQTVTINAKDQPLTQFLSAVLTNMNLEYTIENKTIVISQKSKKLIAPISPDLSQGSQASTIDIRGKVTDESGKPVVGASVQVKGTNKGTTTNNEGEFVLTGVDEKATLVISAVNIETREVAVSGRKEINLVAKAKVSKLEDVEITNINTGYQSIPKERATGSFTQVDNKTLNLQVGSNIINRLEGVASSVVFNKKVSTIPALMVRGLSTINGPTAPLIILDNFPFEGDINTINPNIVESITILKDATAASIWGTRAGNGVIVINTKKAKTNQPFTIDFNANIQKVNKTDVFYSNSISSTDYIDTELFLFNKGYYKSQINDFNKPVISPVVELLDKQSRGLISSSEVAAKIALYRNADVRNDYDKLMYNDGTNQQFSLNLSGGNAQNAWMVSGGYDRSISDLSALYERKNLRFENSLTPSKHLKISTSIYYTSSKNRSGKESYIGQRDVYPYTNLADENGNAVPVAKSYRSSFTDTLGGGKLLDWNYYPLDDYKHNITNTSTENVMGNIAVQYVFNRWFNFEIKYQFESQRGGSRNIQDADSYNARYYVNLFSQLNRATGVVSYIVPKGGQLGVSNGSMTANNFRSQFNFNKIWGNHQLIGFIGNEIREVKAASESFRTYGYDPEINSGIITDIKTAYPIITTGDYYNIGDENTFSEQNRRFVSFFGNAAYTFQKKYSITVSGRKDASNLFGVNTNQKWTPLWSAGFGWDISQEPFYKFKPIKYLKLRLTYGYTGNADSRRSGIVTLNAGAVSANGTGFANSRIRQFPNPSLRWEQVAITNFGLDFQSKDNHFSGSIEYYSKKGIDLFGTSPVDYTAGINSSGITKNVANMVSRGIDITLNTTNSIGVVRLGSVLNLSFNRDKVTKAYISNFTADRYINAGFGITALEGYPVHSVVSYKWAGLDPTTGDPQGYLNGVVSKNYNTIVSSGTTLSDLEFSGSAIPQIFGSFLNSISYRKFQLDISINYKFQYFFKRNSLNYSDLFNGSDRKSNGDFALRWQNPGDELQTDVPSMVYPNVTNRDYFTASSSSLVEKGDHIRLQFINLSYNTSLNLKNISVQKCQLYFNASNLGILWRANKRGIDPDYYSTTTELPPGRVFTVGLKLFFQ